MEATGCRPSKSCQPANDRNPSTPDVRPGAGLADTRLANMGDTLFARMKRKIPLNHRSWRMTVYGEGP